MNNRFFIVFLVLSLALANCSPSDEPESVDHTADSIAVAGKPDTSAAGIDTVEIWDSFAGEPFSFRNWSVSLDSILMFLPSGVTLERETKPSLYHENAYDSITRIKLGESIIEFVKTPSIGYIEYANVADREIEFQRNIRIGDSYEYVCRKFPDVKKQTQPFRKIYINSGEATSTLIMEFKDGKLYKVTFWPYTG